MSKASAYFTVDNLGGKHDMGEIKRELDALPGVGSVSICQSENRVAVDYDTTGVQAGRIGQRLEKMGYRILNSTGDEGKHHGK